MFSNVKYVSGVLKYSMASLFANINPFLQNRFLLLNHSNQTQAEEDNSPIGWSKLLGGVSLSLWYTCYDNCCCPSPSVLQPWGLTPSQPGNPLVHTMHSILQPVGRWDTWKRTNPQCMSRNLYIVTIWVKFITELIYCTFLFPLK